MRRWGVRWPSVIAVTVVTGVIAGCGAREPPPVTSASFVSSPGPLIASHASLACTACHAGGSPLVADEACVDCHAELAGRSDTRGLHAQPAVSARTCTACHSDHRGARFDARWAAFGGPERFDHALTGMKLERGHRIACERCHAPQITRPGSPANQAPSRALRYAGTPTTCVSCHASPHAGTPYTTLACESCHATADRWSPLGFDHAERTRFDTGASHRHVACATCHAPALGARSPSRACASCHASRDPHAGRFAAFACEDGHAPRMTFIPGQPPPAWKRIRSSADGLAPRSQPPRPHVPGVPPCAGHRRVRPARAREAVHGMSRAPRGPRPAVLRRPVSPLPPDALARAS